MSRPFRWKRDAEDMKHLGRLGAEALFEGWVKVFKGGKFTKQEEDWLQQGFARRMLELFAEDRKKKEIKP